MLLPTVDGRNPAPPRDLGCIKPCKQWDKLPTSTVDGRNFWHQKTTLSSPTGRGHDSRLLWRALHPFQRRLGQGSFGLAGAPQTHLSGQSVTMEIRQRGWHPCYM